MMRSRPWRNGLWAAVLLVGLGGLWVSFAPEKAGGQAAYVIVAGASMEPALHRGDLVIARRAAGYQVGDVVAYRHPIVGPVIHRIIAAENGRYTLKGDANAWTDSYDPSQADILGESWLRVPSAGRLLIYLRTPAVLSLLALGISLLLVSMVVPMKRSTSVQPRKAATDRLQSAVASEPNVVQTIVFVLGLICLLSLLLALPAWSRSLTRTAARTLAYSQQGAFDYAARVPAGVYDRGTLQTGDPVFLRLNRTVSVRFDYAFHADVPAEVRGTAQLQAEIRDSNGWHRTLMLQAAQPFAGSEASVFGILDLDVVARDLADLERLTGVTRPFYSLAILPQFVVEGQLAGQPLTTRFAPELDFQLDSLQMQMVREDPSAPGADPTQPFREGSLEYQVEEANTIGLLGASMPVRAARWVSALGLLLGLGSLAALAWWIGRAQRRDPDAAASMKYGTQIVDVEGGAFKASEALQVGSLDDLARAAVRAGTVMHRVRAEAGSQYFVQDGERLYHFALVRSPEPPAQEARPG